MIHGEHRQVVGARHGVVHERARDQLSAVRLEGDFLEQCLADTLRHIAAQGTESFYRGAIAERIVTLERCLDVRNTGRSRADDEAVIPHFQWAGKVDGTHLSAEATELPAWSNSASETLERPSSPICWKPSLSRSW